MEAPNPNKRLCENPNSFPNNPDLNQNDVEQIISSFLSLPDLPSLSSSLSIGCFFDRVLDKLFEASGDSDSDQDRLTDRSLQLASLLQDSAKKLNRKRATLRNSNSWPLPHELTVKVFSVLDTKSLMQVMACCTMFNKCAMDPLCYSHIDLTTGYVDDKVVHTMIHNADKELRSLKLGRIPCLDVSTPSLLTKDCLNPLFLNQDFSGNLLRSLHLYHHRSLDPESLCFVLSACSNLIDLKIVVCDRDYTFPIDKVLEFLPRTCQYLFIEKEIKSDNSSYFYTTTTPFWRNCPDLTSLTLIGFEINDLHASLLIKGFRTCVLKGAPEARLGARRSEARRLSPSIARARLRLKGLLKRAPRHEASLSLKRSEARLRGKQMFLSTKGAPEPALRLGARSHHLNASVRLTPVKTQFRTLKNLNLSRSLGIDGRFLSDDCGGDTQLETLVLRDCIFLESKILLFLDSLRKGNFRFIRHIDVSNDCRLISGNLRSYCKAKFALEKLKEERPGLTFLADFT